MLDVEEVRVEIKKRKLKGELALFIEAAIFLNQLNCGSAEEPGCLMSAPVSDSSLCCRLIEITALMRFEEEQLERMFITSREDGPNGKSNAAFFAKVKAVATPQSITQSVCQF